MKDKKYIITSNPVVIRQAVVYAKNEKDAWDLYWGKNSKKGKRTRRNTQKIKTPQAIWRRGKIGRKLQSAGECEPHQKRSLA